MQTKPVTALIAEDEPLLAQALQTELQRAWPALHVSDLVGDGASALRQTLQSRPDVVFLDIRMPVLTGLEVAAELAHEWGTASGKPFPAIVFVTAYEQFAVQAFEAQATDYLLKPVKQDRLKMTVERLQKLLQERNAHPNENQLEQMQQIQRLLKTFSPQELKKPAVTLNILQVSVGNTIRMIPVEEVCYFEAADKYVRVMAHDAKGAHEYLLRTPLKELIPQLDPAMFWQVHRGTVVRVNAVESVSRDDNAKLWLHMHGLPEKIAVSRLYAHLFKAM